MTCHETRGLGKVVDKLQRLHMYQQHFLKLKFRKKKYQNYFPESVCKIAWKFELHAMTFSNYLDFPEIAATVQEYLDEKQHVFMNFKKHFAYVTAGKLQSCKTTPKPANF
jgi:hypothetical protein